MNWWLSDLLLTYEKFGYESRRALALASSVVGASLLCVQPVPIPTCVVRGGVARAELSGYFLLPERRAFSRELSEYLVGYIPIFLGLVPRSLRAWRHRRGLFLGRMSVGGGFRVRGFSVVV